jgi:Fe(3+) dicitrate transport protein
MPYSVTRQPLVALCLLCCGSSALAQAPNSGSPTESGANGAATPPAESGQPQAKGEVTSPATSTTGAPKAASRRLEQVLIEAARYKAATRYEHSLPEVSGPTITVTKKTTVVDLDHIPTIIDNDQRELFNRMPGVVLAEQQNPTELNISYRGIGNPQESEYVLLMQDGIPLELDWIGYPTAYYLPVPQTISSVQMIRGGSGLLYGPEVQPVINFISRSPASRPVSGTTEQVGGTHGLFSSFNAISGSSGSWGYLADYSRRQSDGQRDNGQYELNGGDLQVRYRIDAHQSLDVAVHLYSLGSGLAGLQSGAQFAANQNLTTSPDDHLWTDRDTAVLTYSNNFTSNDLFMQKIWTGYSDLVVRSDTYTPAFLATGSTLAKQHFNYTGLDGRWLHRWGRGNALTVGYTAYMSHSPYDEWTSSNPVVGRDQETGKALYADDRHTRYGALFAESVFRLPGRFHVVISGRLDREQLQTDETIAPHPYLVNRTYTKNAPLLGFGIGNDFGRGNETYLNISQGFRPLRYLDIASPNGKFNGLNSPSPTQYLTYELGVHGWPSPGLYYDVSLFQVNVKNRIESQALTPTVTVDVNTGSTRNRGIEGEGSYDLRRWSANATDAHLSLFANASYLDARFTQSIKGVAGDVPAYSPHYVLKAGINLYQEHHYKVSLIVDSVARQFFQDTNQPLGTTAAHIPAYTVLDMGFDYTIAGHWRLLGGISNLLNRTYYSRVFLAGGQLEPALGIAGYAGAAYDL